MLLSQMFVEEDALLIVYLLAELNMHQFNFAKRLLLFIFYVSLHLIIIVCVEKLR